MAKASGRTLRAAPSGFRWSRPPLHGAQGRLKQRIARCQVGSECFDEASWLGRLVGAAGDKRKVVLFSHHQPYSLLDAQGAKLVKKLAGLLAEGHIFAWYWGHEHRCVLYDQHPAWGLFGRCVGHSGYPYFRTKLKDAVRVQGNADAGWYRLPAKNLVPGGLLLDGPNDYLADHRNDYGPNGYATLQFDGEHLTEFVHDPNGEAIWKQALA